MELTSSFISVFGLQPKQNNINKNTVIIFLLKIVKLNLFVSKIIKLFFKQKIKVNKESVYEMFTHLPQS